jgi:hypothetical protein
MKIRLQHVYHMPKELEPGVLYVSKEFGAAAHLCPCGCGSKIRTPLDTTEWALTETPKGPTLRPSVGNWQQPCQSHYWIEAGEIRWAPKWTPKQIEQGRCKEEARRKAYFDSQSNRTGGLRGRVWRWLKALFRR